LIIISLYILSQNKVQIKQNVDSKTRYIMVLKNANRESISSTILDLKRQVGTKDVPFILPDAIIVHFGGQNIHGEVKKIFPHLDTEMALATTPNRTTYIFSKGGQTQNGVAEKFADNSGGRLFITSVLDNQAVRIGAFDVIDKSKANFIFTDSDYIISCQFTEKLTSTSMFEKLLTDSGSSLSNPINSGMNMLKNFLLISGDMRIESVTRNGIYYMIHVEKNKDTEDILKRL